MEENKSNLMAKITLRLEKIKELMQGKGFTHFYIPDQFNYDASVDDDFEYEIRYEGKNLFAGYRENAYAADLNDTDEICVDLNMEDMTVNSQENEIQTLIQVLLPYHYNH